ncbi:MAG TPA: methyltransferase [Deferrisomatales bacterium]|nr:methyltransferase [Deferrisomatales bacterium]
MPALDPATFLPPRYAVNHRALQVGVLALELFQVANPNALADSLGPEEFGADERFPYWAELWPASLALAEFLVRRGLPPGVETLELGCGTGLVGVVAARLGARVLFTDFEEDALAFARANHALNLGRPGRTRLVDWRDPPADLAADLVLAADVLYERRFLDPFLDTLMQALRPGGTALVAEPGRAIAEGSVEALEQRGLRRELHLEEVTAGGREHGVWIHELSRSPARG